MKPISQISPIKRYDTCVIFHLYYPDLWNGISSYLLNLGKQFDLYITIPYEVEISEDTIQESFPDAQIYRCENRGRDIAPFLFVFSAIVKLGYKYIGKIHTKKSPHLPNGVEWQQNMLQKVLGSPEMVAQIKAAFDQHPNWGVVAPQGHVTPHNYFLKSNIDNLLRLAKSVGIPTDTINFSFVAGSMFWFRPQALEMLLDTGVSLQDFEIENGQQDGTLAHAFERFFGMVAGYSGYQIAESNAEGVRLFDTSFHFYLLLDVLQDQEEKFLLQIHQNEMTIQGLAAQVSQLAAQVSQLTAQIAGIQNSYSWKLAQLLMKIRLKLFPLGSRREKWFMRLLRAGLYLKNYGLRSFVRKFVDKINHRETVLTGRQSNGFLLTVQDGQKCPSPAISVVIEKNNEIGLPFAIEADVLSWIAAQTIQDTEVVIWDSVQGAAIAMGESDRVWDAPDIEGLCKGLAGRYLCMASPEMLRNNQTYLETNLVALESENLAFTVNVFGKPDWLFPALQNNSLPGNRRVPFLRQIVRTDCIRNGFLIDISNRLEDSLEKPQVVGKILVQTTASSDENALFPFQAVLAESAEYSLVDNYILARSNLRVSWEPLEHSIYPVDTVVSVRSQSSHLPTVMIFMPFLAVGGAERLALQLIRHLQDQIRFVVITTDEMDSALGTTADAFRQVIPFVYTAADYLASPLKFSFLAYLIERFQPNTFYIANGANFIYDVLGELRKRYPSLRIVNQVYDHQFGWINRYNPTVVASINAHISANPNISEAYISHGVHPQNISFVEHAISLDEINPQNYSAERCIEIKQKLGLPLEKKLVTFCARIHPQKRPLDFIELVRRFSNDESVHFLMVGDGPLSAAVDEQISRIGTKNSTRCKFYSPIADIYAITDVLVLPSEYEAMPLVVLETLAMGKPVVATDVGHIRDVVEMTHGGVVVPNIGDVTALRMGVLKALREPVDAVAMRQFIGERFGVSHIAEQYRKVWLGESHA